MQNQKQSKVCDELWKIAKIAYERISPIFGFIRLINDLYMRVGHRWPSVNNLAMCFSIKAIIIIIIIGNCLDSVNRSTTH